MSPSEAPTQTQWFHSRAWESSMPTLLLLSQLHLLMPAHPFIEPSVPAPQVRTPLLEALGNAGLFPSVLFQCLQLNAYDNMLGIVPRDKSAGSGKERAVSPCLSTLPLQHHGELLPQKFSLINVLHE